MAIFTIHQAKASNEALDHLNVVGWDGDFGEYDKEIRIHRDVLFFGGSEKYTPDMSECYEIAGTVEAENLDEVFHIGNIAHDQINMVADRMRSVSIGDIIVDLTNDIAYMVDGEGFTEVEFLEVA